MTYSETAGRILDSAERMARQGGYNSFSFREIAAEIGIKSASVHYHFTNKEILGAALAERYTNRFLAALGEPAAEGADEMLRRYAASYRKALIEDGQMCLCGMFGAEIRDLPDPVARQTRAFFVRNIQWLGQVFQAKGLGCEEAETKAARMIAALEGAMILSRSLQDDALFDRITAGYS
ncbi:TetR/AcrR family transcriptional regulator [Parasedimentitalea maritima]|uniref:TetR family transcriptional regulator n=1 Tax=Parasedimentitalea maritima TaxID=2578117 RepID=A0A6A4RPK4_9RHOB|nr:TetR/AcrR family transcriptional regulator [Zongyanglinia marina]KAE9632442.1 TetR family transcriptional regulator [Zongyanglinia marina]